MFNKKISNPITGPEGSRRLRLPDFKTVSTIHVVGIVTRYGMDVPGIETT
jgi:hypothetical protein